MGISGQGDQGLVTYLLPIKGTQKLLFRCISIAVRYEKEVYQEAWSRSLGRHSWWKAASAVLIIWVVIGILVSDLDTVILDPVQGMVYALPH